MPQVKIETIVDNIFNEQNECHFAGEKKAVCSPKHVVVKMKSYAESKGRKVNSNNPTTIVSTIKNMLDCNSESCVLKRKDFVEFAKLNNIEGILNQFFKPSGPADSFGLLSNFNIDDVLDQFEERFRNRKFLHIPFQMRDFAKVGTQLATLDLARELKTYNTFGVVLNTDYSTGGGIHWFCLFGEKLPGNKVVLEYFNSSGKPPLAEVQAWLHKTKHHLQKSGYKVDVHYSTGIEFQRDDHSCGVYCLAYIWLRLEQVPTNWFRADNFNDDRMHRLRRNLFRSEN